MKSLLFDLHRLIFVRKNLYRLNRVIYQLALRGIGILNYENPKVSGECSFLETLFQRKHGIVLLDVGANVGRYSNFVACLDNSAEIYAFEPHPKTFSRLETSARENRYFAINAAVGDTKGRLPLFDYEENDGSQHASLYQSVIEGIHASPSTRIEVDVLTVDDFIRERNIKHVGLLKIDAEGNEFKVLKGAQTAIQNGQIEMIHFEFNEMNVVSRVFMKDFMDLLKSYRFYRMFPDGLVKIATYSAVSCEIFAYQNIVAIHSSSDFNDVL